MNKFCKSLVVNFRHLRPTIKIGRPVHVQPNLAILSIDRGRPPPPFNIFPASSSIAARPYYRNPRDADTFDGRFNKSQRPYGKPKYARPPPPPRHQELDENEFGDAVPVESVGHDVNFADESNTNGFAEFNLPEPLLRRLEELGYKKPFEIQSATLKHTLEGKDVVGKAFTGSGKTLAFAIPIINRVMKSENRSKRTPKCLVLSPTRELCLQLHKSIQELGPELNCLAIMGGSGYERQVNALNRGVDIVIATPGRLRDLMNRKNFVPDDIELVCLDEADEMLTPNFLDQIQDVIEASRKDKQMLMFSATLNKTVAELVDDYMKSPILVDLTKGKTQKLPANIEHYIYRAPERQHAQLTGQIIEMFKSQRCMVFVNRKILASNISYKLKRMGIRAGELHSDLSQTKREIILGKFRTGSLNVVVATDVASRGLDVPEVDLVIQLEAPPSGVDYYIHRSGRTGRAGRVGKSVLIHSGSADTFYKELSRLVKFKQIDIPADKLPPIDQQNNRFVDDEDDEDDDDFRKRRPSNRSFSKFDRDGRYPPRSRSEPRFNSRNNLQFEEDDSIDEVTERGSGRWRGGRDEQRGRDFEFRRPKNNQYNNYLDEEDDFRRPPPSRDFSRGRKDFRPSNSSTARKSSLDDKDIFDL